MNPEIVEALVRYVAVLSESAARTRWADDRPQYERHLAAAARMFVACWQDPSLARLRSLVAEERRSYGWAYLSDAEGDRAEAAFDKFAKQVESSEGAV